MSRSLRAKVCKWGGVKITDTQSVKIGEGVIFDTNHPELITVDEGVQITMNCIILSHFKDSLTREFTFGPVYIGKNAFIGCNTVICKSVTIGENAIVGASSVVTKSIPPNEVWAGNPAHFIKKRI